SRIKTGVQIGKGSPEEIEQEVKEIIIKEKVKDEEFDLKRFLIERNIGIDCSGLAYYILDTEFRSRGKGKLKNKISFPFCRGIWRSMKCKLRPVENLDVATLAHNDNSYIIPVEKVEPGDMIIILRESKERNHILIIHKVEYIDNIPKIIHYTHSISLPEDGLYGHGVRQETIELDKQGWNKNYIIRRLKCF
ncbi:MAG TPA: hypothetical protein VI775_01690, partial [Candidatus Paceibacterota bacterium]